MTRALKPVALLVAAALAVATALAAGGWGPVPNPAVPHVANLAALKALPMAPGASVFRDGYAAAGDGGGALYTAAATNCAQADNGAQVQPNSGTGCWIAVVSNGPLDIRVWGAVATSFLASGGTDNGPIVQTAFAAGVPLTCVGNYDFKTPALAIANSKLTATLGTCTLYVDAAATASSHLATTIYSVNSNNILIYGIVFDGNYASVTFLNSHLVYFNGGDDDLVDNSKFQNANFVGLTFSGAVTPISHSGVRYSYFVNIGNLWNAVCGGVYCSSAGPLSQASSALSFTNGNADTNIGNFSIGNTCQQVGSDCLDITYQSHMTVEWNNWEMNYTAWRPSTTNPPGTYGTGCVFLPTNVTQISYDIVISHNRCIGATGGGITGSANYSTWSYNYIYKSGLNGIGIGGDPVATTGLDISHNVIMDSEQNMLTAWPGPYPGAIDTICINGSCAGGLKNTSITDNIIGDDQATPTSQYGIHAQTYLVVNQNNIYSARNVIYNMAVANYGGLLSGPSGDIIATVLGESHIPFILAPSGTVSAAGAVTLGTALNYTYANAYLCLPANVLSASTPAGCYFAQFTSTTAGTVYLNAYASGKPAIPGSLTSVTAGQGAYTGVTASNVATYSLPITGGLIGANGSLRVSGVVSYNISSGSKQAFAEYSTYVFGSATSTSTTAAYSFIGGFSNLGVTNAQTPLTIGAMTGGVSVAVPTRGTIDTTANQNLVLYLRLATATDFVVLDNMVVEFIPGV